MVDLPSGRCERRCRPYDEDRSWRGGMVGHGGMGGSRWSHPDQGLKPEDGVGWTMGPGQEGCGRGRIVKLGWMVDPGQEGCGRGREWRVTVSHRWDPGRGRCTAGWKGKNTDGCRQYWKMGG
jgi:hypothetical protein